MKKLTLAAAAFTILLLTNSQAFAEVKAIKFPDAPPYADVYTTGAQNSTVAKSTFSWDEKPWLYIKIQDGAPAVVGANRTHTEWQWLDPITTQPETNYYKFYNATTNQLWIAYSDVVWNSIKKPGDWKITAFTGFTSGPQFSGDTGFKLRAAPEPVSTLLFSIGGLVLAGSLMMRRNMKLA